MSGEVIQFPGGRKDGTGEGAAEEVVEEVVRSPVALFQINDKGQVDLADGVSVSDAVTEFWESVQGVVTEAWADSPLGREKARVQRLAGFLDEVRPGWREELKWRA